MAGDEERTPPNTDLPRDLECEILFETFSLKEPKDPKDIDSKGKDN